MIKRFALLATILIGSLGIAAAPANAQYEGLCGIIVDPTSIFPGGQITVSGQGAPPGSTLELYFGETLLSTTTATLDSDGTFFFGTVTIPANATTGDYTISVRVQGGGEFLRPGTDVLTGIVSVSARGGGAGAGGGGAGAGAGSLPATGSDSLPIAQVGALLLAVGGLGVLASRRRGSAAAAS